MLALIGQFREPYFTVRPASADWKKLSLLSKIPLKGNLEKALLEIQNLNKSLNPGSGFNATILEAIEVTLSYVMFIRISHAISISGRSASLNFFPKRYNKYSKNLIFSDCTMKLRNLIFFHLDLWP